jgi:hypothetical protein
MRWEIFFGVVFSLLAIVLLVSYWFLPFNHIDFIPKSNVNSNFSVTGDSSMQFYPNMRYSDSKISYRIYNCPLQKKNDMEQAFNTISNKTILIFYPVESNEEILITCDSKSKAEGGLFIAGEGGPVNITRTNLFSVIFTGKILLIKESSCPISNIAIHELFHALGFGHSENENNIMYPISDCRQTIGEDILNRINHLYAIPSLPDLTFSNVSANIEGRYLNTEINIINQGLKSSESAKISIYSDESLIKEMDMESLRPSEGLKITLKNILIIKLSTKELNFFINYNQEELDKENNKIVLEVKN